jgi:hypothetical protein
VARRKSRELQVWQVAPLQVPLAQLSRRALAQRVLLLELPELERSLAQA